MATTVKQIKEWPIGYKSGGFFLTVKQVKKFWEVPQPDGKLVGHKGEGRILVSQAILTDLTGDLLADLKIASPEHGNHNPLKVGQAIRVIVCEVQQAYPQKGQDPPQGKKLYIDQYEDYIKQELGTESAWGPDDEAFAWAEARKEEVKGKVRHGIVCSLIKAKEIALDEIPIPPAHKQRINEIVDFIITGQ